MRKILFYHLIFILCLGFCSCSQITEPAAEESISVTLPQWPPSDSFSQEYPALLRWKIEVTGAEKQYSFYTQKNTVSIQTKKNHPFCLTASPVTQLDEGGECIYFKPAGFFYPASTEMTASWEKGFLADLMKELFTEGLEASLAPVEVEYLISTFNWKKAQETIEKKINSDSELFYNPWLVQRKPLLEGISSRTFRATYLNNSGCIPLKMDWLTKAVNSQNQLFLSSYVPENQTLPEKNQFTIVKNTPVLFSDGRKYGFFIIYKTSKNISLEFIYLPIYIEDI